MLWLQAARGQRPVLQPADRGIRSAPVSVRPELILEPRPPIALVWVFQGGRRASRPPFSCRSCRPGRNPSVAGGIGRKSQPLRGVENVTQI